MPAHDRFKDFVSDVIGEAEDFIRPVTDPLREGLAKITPKEIKPYLTTALSLGLGPATGPAGAGYLGFLRNVLGGTARDALIQKLFTDPDDEDTDVDLLRAGTTGFFTGLQGLQPAARLMDPAAEGVELVDGTFQPKVLGDKKAIEAARRLNIGQVDPTATGAALDATFYGAEPSLSNVIQSDVAQGFKDFATPFQFDQTGGGVTGAIDAVGEATIPIQTALAPSQARDAAKALEEAERRYQNYLDTLEADQRASIEADMNERIAAYKEYMGLAGFTNAEIDEALMEAGYLASGETAFARGGRVKASDGLFTEMMGLITGDEQEQRDLLSAQEFFVGLMGDNSEDFARRAFEIRYGDKYDFDDFLNMGLNYSKGGRVGFDMGGDTGGKTDRMGLGNYIEAEKVRTEFTDKMKRGLQAAQMNMKLNDPGLMRFVNALVPGGEGFYTREEMRFPSMKERYEMNIEKMTRDQARDDFEKKKIENELRKELFDNVVDMIDDRFSDNREQRKMANKGGRMTPEGDPISPDVPKGMQMDLRGGGFIPLGTKPKADDVPAMVGLNEFVLNDEAVSGIGKMLTGKPDPRAGARALYKLQDQMEAIV